MSTIIATVFISLALMLNPGSKPEAKTMLLPKSVVETQHATSSQPMVTKKRSVPSANKPVVLTETDLPQKPVDVNALATINQTPEPEITQPLQSHPKWDGKPISGEPYIMELTNEELKKLGILATDSGLYYLNVTPEGVVSEYNRPLFAVVRYKNMNGANKDGFEKRRIGNSENVISFLPFYVNYSTNYQVTNGYNKIKVFSCQYLSNAFPKENQDESFYYRNDSTNLLAKEIFSRVDSISERYFQEKTDKREGEHLKLVDDTLVPIEVAVFKKKNTTSKTEVLWFVSNHDFYNALPIRYKEKVKDFYESIKKLKLLNPNSNLVDYPKYYEDYDYMDNLNYLDLTKEELIRIGITFVNDSDKYKSGMEYRDKIGGTRWCKKPNASMTYSKKFTGEIDLFAPLHSGFKTKTLTQLTKAKIDSALTINELIPVRVKQEIIKDYCPWLNEDQIFWYAPTPAFFDSLPPRIGNELKQDYRVIMARRNPAISVEEKQKMTTSCKYFIECKATLFDVNFTVFPNPVEDNLNIDLTLQKPDKLSIAVFSVGGRKLLTLLPLTEMPAGQQRHTFSASGLEAGMYLVTVQNSKGQVKSQRIVKM